MARDRRSLPEDRSYSPRHEWCRIEGDAAVIGVLPEALEDLGAVVSLELPDAGDDVLHEVPVAEIEGSKGARDVFSLVDGVVEEINGRVAHDPGLLAADPLGEGWILRVKLAPDGKKGEMLTAAEYLQTLGKK